MGYSISRVHHSFCGTSGYLKRKHCLDRYVHCWDTEGFEQDLCHTFAIGLGIEWCLSQKDWVFFRRDTELVVESVVPHLFHVVTTGDDPMLTGILPY